MASSCTSVEIFVSIVPRINLADTAAFFQSLRALALQSASTCPAQPCESPAGESTFRLYWHSIQSRIHTVSRKLRAQHCQ